MLPVSSVDNVAYASLRDVKTGTEFGVGVLLQRGKMSEFDYLGFCHLCHAVSRSSCAAVFVNPILVVVGRRAKKQMIWSDTERIVTVVTDEQPVRNVRTEQLVCVAMCVLFAVTTVFAPTGVSASAPTLQDPTFLDTRHLVKEQAFVVPGKGETSFRNTSPPHSVALIRAILCPCCIAGFYRDDLATGRTGNRYLLGTVDEKVARSATVGCSSGFLGDEWCAATLTPIGRFDRL